MKAWEDLPMGNVLKLAKPIEMDSRLAKKVLSRIEAKVERIAETGCWIWTGFLSPKGYALIRIRTRLFLAHRVTYTLHVKPIPETLDMDHLCRVRCCVNPHHVEPVTPSQNTRRSPIHLSAITKQFTHCPQGHEYSQENTFMSPSGTRRCRACCREYSRQYGRVKRGKQSEPPTCTVPKN